MRSTLIISALFLIQLSSLAGIEVDRIAEGNKVDITWSIYQVRSGSDEADINLMVVLHNTGTKSFDLEGINSNSFSLSTKQGNELEIHDVTGFTMLRGGAFTIGHLTIKRLGEIG